MFIYKAQYKIKKMHFFCCEYGLNKLDLKDNMV